MPVQFPTYDKETATLVPLDYYSVEEVAEMLHVSVSAVRARLVAGEWPFSSVITGRRYLTAEHIGMIMELSTHGVADDMDTPPSLGVPVADADTEGLR